GSLARAALLVGRSPDSDDQPQKLGFVSRQASAPGRQYHAAGTSATRADADERGGLGDPPAETAVRAARPVERRSARRRTAAADPETREPGHPGRGDRARF